MLNRQINVDLENFVLATKINHLNIDVDGWSWRIKNDNYG